jgi:membrane protein YdbS with pleckstrin-like domain
MEKKEMKDIKKKIVKHVPLVFVVYALSVTVVFLISVLQLALQWSASNYQIQMDAVLLVAMVVLPTSFILGVIGLYLKISRLEKEMKQYDD